MASLLIDVVAAAALAYLLACAYLYLAQGRQIFKPLRDIEATPADYGLPYEDIDFRSGDSVRLNGWYVPCVGARHALMFFHGNTRNISYCLDSVSLFHRLGFHVFLFDYRGYGRSEGRPGEQGTYLDAEAAWQYLVETRRIDAATIVMLGRSLGAAIASWLAVRHQPQALVIESTFTSLPDVAAEMYPYLPARLLARHRYPVARYLPQVHCPLLVVHSREDEITRFHHATALYAVANEPKELFEISGRHYDGYSTSGKTYEQGLDRFVRRYLTLNGDRSI